MREIKPPVMIIEVDFDNQEKREFNPETVWDAFEAIEPFHRLPSLCIKTPTGSGYLVNLLNDKDTTEAIRGCDPHHVVSINAYTSAMTNGFRYNFIDEDRHVWRLRFTSLEDMYLTDEGIVEMTQGPEWHFSYHGKYWRVRK